MSTQALTPRGEMTLTAAEIRSNVNLIQEVMRTVMIPDVHYGRIPGCGDKPALFKPGSEKILATFRIAVEPVITDLSTGDVAHFRVEARGISASGQYLGSGIGEASSLEAKYCWRAVVCDEEWDATPEHRRRVLWKKGNGGAYSARQVRTEAADIANTVLKMAKKRAQIDMTLTVTAASDCFAQDIEDLPEEMRGEGGDAAPRKPPIPQVQRRGASPATTPAAASAVNVISEAQGKRFYAIYKGAGWKDDEVKGYLKANFGIDHSRDIPRKEYDELCKFFAVPRNAAPANPDSDPAPVRGVPGEDLF